MTTHIPIPSLKENSRDVVEFPFVTFPDCVVLLPHQVNCFPELIIYYPHWCFQNFITKVLISKIYNRGAPGWFWCRACDSGSWGHKFELYVGCRVYSKKCICFLKILFNRLYFFKHCICGSIPYTYIYIYSNIHTLLLYFQFYILYRQCLYIYIYDILCIR